MCPKPSDYGSLHLSVEYQLPPLTLPQNLQSVSGTPLLGLILLHFGMRANFAATAVLSILYALLFAFSYRDPRAEEVDHSAQVLDQREIHLTLPDLLRQRKVLAAAIGSGAYNYSFYLLLTWMPFYLQKGVRMTESTSSSIIRYPLACSSCRWLHGWRHTNGCARASWL